MKKFIKNLSSTNRVINFALSPKYLIAILIPLIMIAGKQVAVINAWLSAEVFNILQEAIGGASASVREALFTKALLFASAIFGVHILSWLLSSTAELIETWWRDKVDMRMQHVFLRRDLLNDIADFDNPELNNRRAVAKGVSPINILKTLFSFASELLLILSFTVVLWGYNPILIPVALVAKLPLYWVSSKLKEHNTKFEIETNTLQREKNYFYHLPIDRQTAKEFRIFDMDNYTCGKFDDATERYLRSYKKKYSYERFIMGIEDNYDTIVLVIIQIIVGLAVFRGKMEFGTFTLLIAAFTNVAKSAQNIANYAAECKDIGVKSAMLCEYLDSTSIYSDGEKKKREITGTSHTIEFRNITFSYPGTDKKILDGLSLKIESGQTTALVGLNGSGKTTLVNLLLRLYKPDSGEILLDGVNVEEYNIHSYYRSIACVFQSVTKYSIPIIDYICTGNSEDADIEKVRAALSQVKLNDWIDELPMGLNTALTRLFSTDSESVEPSLGQWQKLSIARVIYKDAPIMVLDEPSASLDVDTENEIFNYMSKLAVKKTALLISHRLSNVMECDMIFLIENGKLAEEGTHHELLAKNGIYTEMFYSQAKYYNVV